MAINTGSYQYYHLLSGEDLPIKSQDYIHGFFSNNNGKEFIRFENRNFLHSERITYYHIFQENIGRGQKHPIFRRFNMIFLKIQKLMGIRRNKNIDFQKGTNWFSITDALARYVVCNKEWIEKVFSHSFCADEIFLQTLVHNSPFVDNLYYKNYDNDLCSIMRLIDWERGYPYIFQLNDEEELRESKMLFARKFDAMVDSEIIKRLPTIVEEMMEKDV